MIYSQVMTRASLACTFAAGFTALAILMPLRAQDPKSPTRAAFTDLIGQSAAQVTAILGKPDNVKPNKKKEKDGRDDANAIWSYSLSEQKKLHLKMVSGTVQSLKVSKTKAAPAVAQGSGPYGNMTNSLANTYLASACPQVRMKPQNALTTNESELLTACVAAGF